LAGATPWRISSAIKVSGPPAPPGRRTDGELGRHHDSEGTPLAQLAPPQQQAQAQRIEIPADQHHGEHGDQQAAREMAQPLEQAGTAEQQRHHGRCEQRATQQPPASIHAAVLVER
jgi:hypothetical protein